MTPVQALITERELEALCRKNQLWYEVSKSHRPELKIIKYEIQIKVEEQEK